MKKKIIINECNNNTLLRLVDYSDIELLRVWKNDNKKSFFYQNEISQSQQKEWFNSYQTREDDFMFIIEEGVNKCHFPIGCMGFRIRDGYIDLYNIIRGRKSVTGASIHGAMHMMLNYIILKYDLPIRCDVLKGNSAVQWYLNCGFYILKDEEYFVMQIDKDRVEQMNLTIHEEDLL